MATLEGLAAQIKGLEAQIAVLKAQLDQLSPASAPVTFGDLYGVLAGKADLNEEEIDSALYRLRWDDELGEADRR